jgi:hypothetical protein
VTFVTGGVHHFGYVNPTLKVANSHGAAMPPISASSFTLRGTAWHPGSLLISLLTTFSPKSPPRHGLLADDVEVSTRSAVRNVSEQPGPFSFWQPVLTDRVLRSFAPDQQTGCAAVYAIYAEVGGGAV